MRIIDADRYRKDLLSTYDDVSIELEVLDRQPLISAIPIEKLKNFRNEVMSMNSIAIIQRLDKLIEEVE